MLYYIDNNNSFDPGMEVLQVGRQVKWSFKSLMAERDKWRGRHPDLDLIWDTL